MLNEQTVPFRVTRAEAIATLVNCVQQHGATVGRFGLCGVDTSGEHPVYGGQLSEWASPKQERFEATNGKHGWTVTLTEAACEGTDPDLEHAAAMAFWGAEG